MRTALIAVFLFAAPFAAQAATYEKTPCPATVAQDEKIECGILAVPENRHKADSRTIRLPVMIFRSRSATPAPDPVIFLPGGPGGSSVANKHSGKNNPFLDDRDYILLEPRGAKMAQPALECPRINAIKGEVSAGRYSPAAGDAALTAAAAQCRTDLTAQGIDLDGYTSAQTADDIDDLRQVLGIAQWNVFGHSYGTRLALTLLRDHPQGIRSIILDSVLPPEADFDASASANLWRAIHAVFDGCAVDSACHTAWPDLEQHFRALVEQANAAPLVPAVPITGSDGKPATVNGAAVIDAIYSALHDPSAIGRIPAIIEDAYAGRTDALMTLVKNNQGPSGFTWGLRLSVWCGEEMPFQNPALVEDQTASHWGLGGIDERTASIAICKAWNVAPADAREKAPVSSETPVLVLSGEFDPDTPPQWARGLLAHLPNARVVLMPGQSHGAGFNRCGGRLETAFLRDPQGVLDTGCVVAMPSASFAPLPLSDN